MRSLKSSARYGPRQFFSSARTYPGVREGRYGSPLHAKHVVACVA